MGMKTNILIIVLLLLFSISVNAMFGDSTTIFVEDGGGDSEIYMTEQAGDLELGNFWTYVTRAILRPPGPSGGTGEQQAGTGRESTPYYDVILLIEPLYKRGDIINFSVIIINKGDEPDRDAVLSYYIVDPSGNMLGSGREVFEEVPQTCMLGKYDMRKEVCVYLDQELEPFVSKFNREIALSYDAESGYWTLYLEYETEKELIKVHKSFMVGKITLVREYAIYFVIIIILVKLLNDYLNRRKRKKKVDEIIEEAEEQKE